MNIGGALLARSPKPREEGVPYLLSTVKEKVEIELQKKGDLHKNNVDKHISHMLRSLEIIHTENLSSRFRDELMDPSRQRRNIANLKKAIIEKLETVLMEESVVGAPSDFLNAVIAQVKLHFNLVRPRLSPVDSEFVRTCLVAFKDIVIGQPIDIDERSAKQLIIEKIKMALTAEQDASLDRSQAKIDRFEARVSEGLANHKLAMQLEAQEGSEKILNEEIRNEQQLLRFERVVLEGVRKKRAALAGSPDTRLRLDSAQLELKAIDQEIEVARAELESRSTQVHVIRVRNQEFHDRIQSRKGSLKALRKVYFKKEEQLQTTFVECEREKKTLQDEADRLIENIRQAPLEFEKESDCLTAKFITDINLELTKMGSEFDSKYSKSDSDMRIKWDDFIAKYNSLDSDFVNEYNKKSSGFEAFRDKKSKKLTLEFEKLNKEFTEKKTKENAGHEERANKGYEEYEKKFNEERKKMDTIILDRDRYIATFNGKAKARSLAVKSADEQRSVGIDHAVSQNLTDRNSSVGVYNRAFHEALKKRNAVLKTRRDARRKTISEKKNSVLADLNTRLTDFSSLKSDLRKTREEEFKILEKSRHDTMALFTTSLKKKRVDTLTLLKKLTGK